jgi:hypothetical protein
MLLDTVLDVQALNPLYLEFGAACFVVPQFATMPAVNRANRRLLFSAALHECHSLAVWLSGMDVPWGHLVFAEEASRFNDRLGVVVGPFRHVILQVGLDLIESAIV